MTSPVLRAHFPLWVVRKGWLSCYRGRRRGLPSCCPPRLDPAVDRSKVRHRPTRRDVSPVLPRAMIYAGYARLLAEGRTRCRGSGEAERSGLSAAGLNSLWAAASWPVDCCPPAERSYSSPWPVYRLGFGRCGSPAKASGVNRITARRPDGSSGAPSTRRQLQRHRRLIRTVRHRADPPRRCTPISECQVGPRPASGLAPTVGTTGGRSTCAAAVESRRASGDGSTCYTAPDDSMCRPPTVRGCWPTCSGRVRRALGLSEVIVAT